jgi:hypothetical protein
VEFEGQPMTICSFDNLHTALLGLPQGALICIWIGAGAFLNAKLPSNSRTWVCM